MRYTIVQRVIENMTAKCSFRLGSPFEGGEFG